MDTPRKIYNPCKITKTVARNYHQIDVYHLAYDFVLQLYFLTKNFPKSEEQNITSQLRRAAVSIPLNIVEGSAKASNREFAYYLNVAYASAKEVEVLLQLSKDLKYLDEEGYIYLAAKLDPLNAKLFLFLRNVEARIGSTKFQFFKKFEEKMI